MNKYFLKYKFSYLLAMLSLTSIAQNMNANRYDTLIEFGNLFQEMDGNIKAFLSKNDNRTLIEYTAIIRKTIDKYPLKVRSKLQSDLDQPDLDMEVNKIVQEFKKPFIKTPIVLQKYQGKDKRFAGSLVKDLKEALPLKQFFLNLKAKLIALQKKAITQNDIRLISLIKNFIKYINQKSTDWDKMSQIELFSALCRRMNLR